jgi:UDP-GlcNAc:undecaprenyl-phosphate GlcNAc-1-phosphate transferase
MQFIRITIPIYLLLGALTAARIPFDIAVVAATVLASSGLSLMVRTGPPHLMLLRLALYLGVACEVFLWHGAANLPPDMMTTVEVAYFIMLGAAVALTLRVESAHGFRTTPLDFLMVFVVVTAAALSDRVFSGGLVGADVIVRLAILFYASELAISGSQARARGLSQWSLIGASLLLLGKTLSLA